MDLIIDLKKTTSSLLKSISLDWNDNLRNYQKTALSKRIKTPSYNQVTEKLYTRAKGRWENYKLEMKDVTDFVMKHDYKYRPPITDFIGRLS